MDSPIRQYQKQKDYRRHKLFRKMKRRQTAERQQAINAPMKELKRRLKRRLKRYAPGKDGEEQKYWVRDDNGNPIRFNEEGKFEDQVTGETGTLQLPEVRVHPEGWNYRTAYHPEDVEQAFNLTGLGYIFNPFRLARTTGELLTKPSFQNAVEVAHDVLPWFKAGRFLLGTYNLANENGLAKTIDYTKNGEYGKAALSAIGDVLNAAMMVEGGAGAAGQLRNKLNPVINSEQITAAELDAAYTEAIAAGDIQEAQRLRDLHFIYNAPETKIVTESGKPLKTIHGTDANFNSFDPNYWKYGAVGKGNYVGNAQSVLNNAPHKKELYINSENPLVLNDVQREAIFEDVMSTPEMITNQGYDGVVVNYKPKHLQDFEMVNYDSRKIKSADAITYDDAGNVIPLSERDNFNINDIRYGWPMGKESKGKLVEDFTDFNTMVERMNSTIKFNGKNPFADGKMTGFRKWALDNGASPQKIVEIEDKYSKNNWSALKKYTKVDEDSSGAGKGYVQIYKNNSNFNQIFPHEVEHRLIAELFGEDRMSITVKEAVNAFKDDLWKIPKNADGDEMYYLERNFEELLPRFTQIKNALGIKEHRALTVEELKRAYNMFKTGSNKLADNMRTFFNNIKDWDAAAKLSGKALGITGLGYSAANWLDDNMAQNENFNSGKDSGIHINPKNRGKFNALKKRTGKTTEQLTHSKNPLTRKRAIFAQNARKWSHK